MFGWSYGSWELDEIVEVIQKLIEFRRSLDLIAWSSSRVGSNKMEWVELGVLKIEFNYDFGAVRMDF